MIDISDSLNTVAMSATPAEQRALSNQLAGFAARLNSIVSIDWQTGAASFDEAEVRAAAEELQSATAFAVGTSFADRILTDLRGGFAVLDRDTTDAIPLQSLKDPLIVNRLSAERLQALGVRQASPDTVLYELGARYGSLPTTLDTASAANLIDAMRDRQVLNATAESKIRLTALMPQRPTNGPANGGGGGGGGLGGVVIDIAKAVPDFVTQCMPNISPTRTDFWTGLGLCFDETCARRFAAILSAGGAPALAAAGAAALGAGSISAAIAAAVAAVGGWVAFIVIVCIVIFSGWFSSCITSNGACIHFPWWAGFGPIPYGR